jgi:hypothetical protein
MRVLSQPLLAPIRKQISDIDVIAPNVGADVA